MSVAGDEEMAYLYFFKYVQLLTFIRSKPGWSVNIFFLGFFQWCTVLYGVGTVYCKMVVLEGQEIPA
jgi:hypothetical protein